MGHVRPQLFPKRTLNGPRFRLPAPVLIPWPPAGSNREPKLYIRGVRVLRSGYVGNPRLGVLIVRPSRPFAERRCRAGSRERHFTTNFGSMQVDWHSGHMNLHTPESIPAYALRRCREDLAQARHERRFFQSILEEAKREQAEQSIAIIRRWLPKSRREINRLCARRTRLQLELEIADESKVSLDPASVVTSDAWNTVSLVHC